MTRALLALLLALAQFQVAAAPRRRAVQHPAPFVTPAAIVTAAHQAAEAALAAGVPAVQIAVYEGGRVVYSEAFGVTDKVTATAATPQSVLQIASVTKQFTSAAILRLAERGALTLDDRIEKFVPEFNPRGETITLRHLLTHTSGVARDWMPPATNLLAPATRQQVMNGINAKPFDFTPGTMWSYSNSGYMLLGYAIESITGKSYAEFIQHEFALPLGLLDTGVCGTNNLPVPAGYGPNGKLPAIHATVLWSSGSFCSTATDLARWAHLLATGRVLLPASYAAMTTPAQVDFNNMPPYGLGLMLAPQIGHEAVFHGGAVGGFQSFLIYFPARQVSVAVITNAFPAPAAGNPQMIAVTVAKAALSALEGAVDAVSSSVDPSASRRRVYGHA
jgi:CubicO group peptidase (beta-lactamase class C family)